MFQDLDTTMCGIKRKKNIFWGLGEQNITINQQQFNTQTHTRNITVAGTQCSQLGGGGDEADGDRLSRHRCPSQAHTPSRQHPLAVYRYTLKSIYTTHTTKNIYTGPKEEKKALQISQRRREKKHIRTHTCRVEDSFLLPWPSSCHYHRQ